MTETEKLKESLFRNTKTGWEGLEENVRNNIFKFCDEYITFLNKSPRLDLKPNPLYEESGLAYLKTHYYGGVKKYQWTTIPLSMHGVIVKANGERQEICIGEDEKDPIFTITDLLPHLASEQMERKLKEGIKGEELNLLIGSIPYNGESIAEAVKLNILKILNDKYGITEIDFVSSEIELVPAFNARTMGLDKSMVARIWSR